MTHVEGIWHLVRFLQGSLEATGCLESTSLGGTCLGECELECSLGTVGLLEPLLLYV